MIQPFAISGVPNILFGVGRFAELAALAGRFGRRVLIVTGGRSLRETPQWPQLLAALHAAGLDFVEMKVDAEPSPQLVDAAVAAWHGAEIDVVVGIGGGSVLDAAKAIAGLLPHGNSVMDHLEGVGPELPYRGPSTPYLAVPTTAGTGSEATKNAVLSVRGPDGFKKSFRHDCLVPRYAIVDPDLLKGCPRELIAANGMDALTQLLESYVSARSSPFTDALSLSGLMAARDGLLPWYEQGPGACAAQSAMAYAALLSGIALAQAGLGSVHGLAAPIGAYFPVPHGVVCGTLVAAATEVNITVLERRARSHPALAKYARAGQLLAGDDDLSDEDARRRLVETLAAWTQRLGLPRLSAYGITAEDFDAIVAGCRGSSMKTNPVVLEDSEIREILLART
ncbi:MAG: iron-containing alcohol dehydrogenase [Acidiferrobacterales bacterium]